MNTGKFLSFILCSLFILSCSHLPLIGKKEEKPLLPEEAYKKGEEALFKKDYKQAQTLFKNVLEQNPESKIVENARLNLAESYYNSGNYEEAIVIYEDYLKLYPLSPNSDYVLFKLGMSYWHLVKPPDRDQTNTVKAIETFKKLIQNYPFSPWVQEAKEKLKECEERLAENDIYVGKFYLKTGQFTSAETRFKEVMAKSSNKNLVAEANYLLCKTYEKKGEREKAISCHEELIKKHPAWEHIDKAENSLKKLQGKNKNIIDSVKNTIKEDLLGIY